MWNSLIFKSWLLKWEANFVFKQNKTKTQSVGQKHPGQTKHICGLGLSQELQVCDFWSRNSNSKTITFRLKNVLYANFLVLATELAGTPFTNIELLEKNITFLLLQIKNTELSSKKR